MRDTRSPDPTPGLAKAIGVPVFQPDDAYSQVLANSTQTTVTNGLNQLSTVNGTAAAYDARGNMTTDPATGKTYSYYVTDNQLWNVPSPYATLGYDALSRLWSVNKGAAGTTVYAADGNDAIAEYDGNNVLQKRYAFDGNGQPLVQYDAAGNRTWMLSDERGSVVALANDSAAMTSINTYDEYGIPAATNSGTFQYAGMLWLANPGLYGPTFRAYAQHLGRFNQTDPIGMNGGINLYAFVGADPVNGTDPLGLCKGTDVFVRTGGSVTGTGANGGDVTVTVFGHCVSPAGGAGALGASPNGTGPGEGRGGAGNGQRQKQQQKQTCQTRPFKRVLSNPAVQQQIAKALTLATQTQNEGSETDIAENGTEFAFNVYDFGIGGLHTGGIYTGSGGHLREGRVDYQAIFAVPFLFNVRSSYVFVVHIHQSPRGIPGLSTDDMQLGVNVIAVQPNGEVFCAPAS